MGSNASRSSRLFLIELICAVLFFSLGSAVCVQAFARAHILSTQARDLSFASATVSGAASVLRYTDTPEGFLEYYPKAVVDDNGTVFACYGADFAPCGEDDGAAYVLRAEKRREGAVEYCDVAMYDAGGAELYALDLRWPAAGEGAEP